MRLLLAAVALLVGMSGAARADDFPCVSTTFNLLSPNDKVCISDFDDPAVPGVTCFISQARTGGWGQPFGLNEDPSNFSVSCRQMGPIITDIYQAAGEGGGVHREDQHLLQADAYLPHPRREAERHYLSRRQLQDHQRLARQRDQRRADHALAEIAARLPHARGP